MDVVEFHEYMERLKKHPDLIEKLRVRCVEVIDELGEPQGSDPILRAMYSLGDDRFLELLNETVPVDENVGLPDDEDAFKISRKFEMYRD